MHLSSPWEGERKHSGNNDEHLNHSSKTAANPAGQLPGHQILEKTTPPVDHYGNLASRGRVSQPICD